LTSLHKKHFPRNKQELKLNLPIPAANLAKLQILWGYLLINYNRLVTIAKSWIIKCVNQTGLCSEFSFSSPIKLKLQAKTIKKIQILWCSTFIALSGWYLFWLSDDILVWHKSILEVNMTNLYGTFICSALILATAKIDMINNLPIPRLRSKKLQKPSQTNTVKLLEMQNEPTPKSGYTNKINRSTQQNTPWQTTNQPKTRSQIGGSTQFEAPMQTPKKPKRLIQPQTLAEHECAHFFGYLHQRERSKEIPDQCLICKNLIDCSSKTD
jgi:hypothetical protein